MSAAAATQRVLEVECVIEDTHRSGFHALLLALAGVTKRHGAQAPSVA